MLPKWRGYRIRQELILLEGQTAKVHRLVKVPLAELATWDVEHDVLGQKIVQGNRSGEVSEEDQVQKN